MFNLTFKIYQSTEKTVCPFKTVQKTRQQGDQMLSLLEHSLNDLYFISDSALRCEDPALILVWTQHGAGGRTQPGGEI